VFALVTRRYNLNDFVSELHDRLMLCIGSEQLLLCIRLRNRRLSPHLILYP
jgi:hypothetical protein